MNLEQFKEMARDVDFKERITGRNDIIDFDNGTMVVYREHLNKYLEQYICKDEDDLSDTLYYNYGIYLHVAD